MTVYLLHGSTWLERRSIRAHHWWQRNIGPVVCRYVGHRRESAVARVDPPDYALKAEVCTRCGMTWLLYRMPEGQ